jgi:cytochrome c-type biogenesis protein
VSRRKEESMPDSASMREKAMETNNGRRFLMEKRWLLLLSFGVPAAIVAIALILLLRVQTEAESAVSNFAALLPVGYAFGAGMVASVNPCGFFMLPSYISYHLGTEDPDFYQASVSSRLGKSFLLGGVATAGFVVIFAVVGTVIAAGGQWLIRVFPYAGVAIGALMVGLGLWLLVTHRTLGIRAASRVTLDRQRNLRNVFFFGIAYAVGSLSCTLPIFLVVVGGSLVSEGIAASMGQFVSYALGMGLILVAVTIGSALFQGSVARWLRRAIPYVHRASALFLVAAGAYLVYYWVFLVGLTF